MFGGGCLNSGRSNDGERGSFGVGARGEREKSLQREETFAVKFLPLSTQKLLPPQEEASQF